MCYTDASFASLTNSGSQEGTLVFLVGDTGRCNLISWNSKRIKRVAKSALAAETLALSSGMDTSTYIASLFSELWHGSLDGAKLPIELVVDNLSLFDALKSTKQVQDKRLRIDVAIAKEMLSRGEIKCVRWIDAKQQPADSLTKAGASSARLMKLLRNGNIYAVDQETPRNL